MYSELIYFITDLITGMNHHNIGLLQIPYYMDTYNNVRGTINVIVVGLVGFAAWTIYKKLKKKRSENEIAETNSTDNSDEES